MATAGDSKSGLDPFLPQRSKDLKQQQRLLHEIHDNFVNAVRRRPSAHGRAARQPLATLSPTRRQRTPPPLTTRSQAPRDTFPDETSSALDS